MILSDFFSLNKSDRLCLNSIKGPIVVLGTGGFIGANMLASLSLYRKDVYGASKNISRNWRIRKLGFTEFPNLIELNMTKRSQIQKVIRKVKPKTVFNFIAYGGYSKDQNISKIYETNFLSVQMFIEELKKTNFKSFINAGTSSVYGENSQGPKEESTFYPNSHYAVSKAAVSNLISYYGQVEKLPVIDLRLYSVYGPLEEKDRFIPKLLLFAKRKQYPPLVSPFISRDFIYVSDVVSAFIQAAAKINPDLYGQAFNVGTGKKSTIKKVVQIVKKQSKIPTIPHFSTMQKREWDHGNDWYSNSLKINKYLHWHYSTNLEEGIKKTIKFNNE